MNTIASRCFHDRIMTAALVAGAALGLCAVHAFALTETAARPATTTRAVTSTAVRAPREIRLITSSAAATKQALEFDPCVKRACAVTLNTAALKSPAALVAGDVLALDLFEDASYRVVIVRVSTDVNGTLTLAGKVQGCALESFTLVCNNGVAMMELRDIDANRLFKISYTAASRTHYLLEYDVTRMPPARDLPPVEAPPDNTRTQ